MPPKLQHELNPVGLATAPSRVTARDHKAALLGGCVAPTWKRLDLEPALPCCSDTGAARVFRWAYLRAACKRGEEEIQQGPTIIKIHPILLPFVNSDKSKH